MKFTKADKLGLLITCPIFLSIGIPLVAYGYVAGIVAICFGIANLLLGILIPEDKGVEK